MSHALAPNLHFCDCFFFSFLAWGAGMLNRVEFQVREESCKHYEGEEGRGCSLKAQASSRGVWGSGLSALTTLILLPLPSRSSESSCEMSRGWKKTKWKNADRDIPILKFQTCFSNPKWVSTLLQRVKAWIKNHFPFDSEEGWIWYKSSVVRTQRNCAAFAVCAPSVLWQPCFHSI